METEAVTHALRWTASRGDSQTTHALLWTAAGGDSQNTHALLWIAAGGDCQTTHAILLTDSMSLLQKMKSGMGSPDWNVPMVDIHLRKLLGMYCHGHAGVKGNHRADRLAAKATHTCFSEALKC